MGNLVSSRLDYSDKYPARKIPSEEIDHELDYLKKRERVSTIVAIAGTVIAMIALAGILGAGHIVFGAVAAIALVAAVYAYWCRQAESTLRAKQAGWLKPMETPPLSATKSHLADAPN